MNRRQLLISAALCAPIPVFAAKPDAAQKLIAAAESQIGVTISYDPAYEKLAYPYGDVDQERGVCTDVVIRAYRKGLSVDLQALVHEDMRRNFSAYPKSWGLSKPDTNIDHRRVPNLQRYFERQKAKLQTAPYQPGDLVTFMLPGHLPHIAVVSAVRNTENSRYLVVHNIGAGTQREDILDSFPVTGHFRFLPA